MKMDNLMQFLEARIARCKEKAEELTRDNRRDEAVFEKVQENVYDIFRTVWDVAEKQSGGDVTAARSFFQIRLAQIPLSWAQSLEKAQQHGDDNKALIERLKLAAIDDIKAAFAQYQEGNA